MTSVARGLQVGAVYSVNGSRTCIMFYQASTHCRVIEPRPNVEMSRPG